MSRGDSQDLALRATRLANLAETVTLGTIEDTIQMGMFQLGRLPGDPAGLTDLAGAYRAAATALADTGAELLTEYSGDTVPWQGKAAAEAAGVITAESRRLTEDAEVLSTTATLLARHAEAFTQARREHEELHQRFVDLRHNVTIMLPIMRLEPATAYTWLNLVAGALSDSAALLESVRADADNLAEGMRRMQDGGVAAARELVAPQRVGG